MIRESVLYRVLKLIGVSLLRIQMDDNLEKKVL